MQIGKIHLPLGLFLAPMAGFTDRPFRLLAARWGAEYTVTEMVSARALTYGDKKTGTLCAILPEDPPTAIQIFGSEPSVMAEAAGILLEGRYEGAEQHARPVAIDLNMGCPVHKIVSNGEGSRLMQNPTLCGDITAAVSRVCLAKNVPVTVKIRAGWDSEHINACEVALATVEGGASAVTLHGRTREQMYRPGVNLAVIAAVRDALPTEIPVVGNGDIASPDDALFMLRETGCDGIMIGRGALGEPWLFREIAAEMTGVKAKLPTKEEKIETALGLLREIIAQRGDETAGVREARGRISHFIKGFRGGSAARDKLNRVLTYREAAEALQSLLTE